MSDSTLNLSNYTTVWQDNFTSDSQLNSGLFPISWGDSGEYSFGGNGLTLTSDGNAAGFMNADQSATDGTGYGLYSATFSMPAGQDGGYVCLWPSTNVWPGPEIDLGEQLNGQAFLTVHWEGAGDTNQYQSFDINANIADPTTVAVDWESSGLTFYVNGQEVVSYAAGGPVPVPQDAADGGENESFGVGNVGGAGASITVQSMSYATYNGGSSSGSSSTPSSTGTTSGSTSSGGSTSGDNTSTAGSTATISSTTTTTTQSSFATTGNPNDWSAQSLSTSPGVDIMKGGHGLDTFTIDATNTDGWAQIDHFHSGDVALILGFVAGQSTITWTTATDPAGKTGATADISLNGNGHTDLAVTFAGTSVSQAEAFGTGTWWTSNGTPDLGLWKI